MSHAMCRSSSAAGSPNVPSLLGIRKLAWSHVRKKGDLPSGRSMRKAAGSSAARSCRSATRDVHLLSSLRRYRWQVPKHVTHAFTPLLTQSSEISIALGEAVPYRNLERVPFIANQIYRHPNRKITAHGRIERHQYALHGITQVGGRPNNPINNRLPILRLAGLKEGCVSTSLNK